MPNRGKSINAGLGKQLLVTNATCTNTPQTGYSDRIRNDSKLREVVDTGEELRGETTVGLKQAEHQIRV